MKRTERVGYREREREREKKLVRALEIKLLSNRSKPQHHYLRISRGCPATTKRTATTTKGKII